MSLRFVFAVAVVCAVGVPGGAQSTAPSGALSPAAPANASPTQPGQNTATPQSNGSGSAAGVPQSPAAQQSNRPATSTPRAGDIGGANAAGAGGQNAASGTSGANAPVIAPSPQPGGTIVPPGTPQSGYPAGRDTYNGTTAQSGPTLPTAPSATNATQAPAASATGVQAPAATGTPAGMQQPVASGAQGSSAAGPALGAQVAPGEAGGPTSAIPGQAAGGPVITLEEAITRAKSVDHNYVSAVVDKGTADAEKAIARSAVLPNVDYHNQVIYTQPQRPYHADPATAEFSPNPIFIANNSVREYISQGVVTETVGLGKIADLRKSYADAAAAKAKLEVARRGLIATVVGAYYGLLAANEKQRVAAEALDEANRFVVISRQLEAGGEVAHSDVLKAQIEQGQRDRDFQDAQLTALKARLDLGVLLFADPTQEYSLAADLNHPPALATRGEMEANAKNASPDVRAALASLRAAQLGITSAQAAYFPDLSLAYNYGIDSDHFAVHDANGVRNLGYAATATLDIPVWDWFATRAKVKQSELQRDLAKADLTAAQRRVLAAFQEFYGEAEVASRQLASLERSVADAREALRLTTDKYKAGEGAVLEVVDAQNTYVTAESARADGVVRYYTALANLQTMTGNLP